MRRFESLDRPFTINFFVTDVEQLLNVRQFILEEAFQHIREGANPFEVFGIVETEMCKALGSLMTVGCETVSIEINMYE